MITSVWLNGITIVLEDTRVCIDCYGSSNDKIFIIESVSYQSTTEVIDAWSC